MAWENKLSPLFGHMETTPSDPASSQTSAQPLPDKTASVLETLSQPIAEAPAPSNPMIPAEAPSPVDASPSVLFAAPSVQSDAAIPENSIPLAVASVPEPMREASPSTPDAAPIEPPVFESIPTPADLPVEKIEKEDISQGAAATAAPKIASLDSRLAQYLQSDHVYQSMKRSDDLGKIRLQLALRYTLLMFAIFLVFAWIVSNRIIMFGFSEFVWLARIRDALFAIMAGLFSLTIWFGSPVWMHRPLLITILRSLSIVFFGAVLLALYIPF